MSDRFDIIIAGAGLAGLSAAWTLAGAGLEVLVLERGDYPGSKNVTGGRLYVHPVRELLPGLLEGAPFERRITREGVTVMAEERSVTIDYTGNELRTEPAQSYSVLRSKFDRSLAKRAETAGAMILTKAKVDDVIRENGKICGVAAGGDELRSDAVIVCDGVLSLIAEKAGLRKTVQAREFAVGVKEVLALEPGVINDRFNLENDEGAARLYLGDVTRKKFGGGFLYTNRDSVSLGVVAGIKDFCEDEGALEIPALLEQFKKRPEVASLIRGGVAQEYSAHVIPESGYGGLGALCGDGILVAGDAAGLALNIGFTVRGMEYALASGYFAAQAVMKAKEAGDFSAQSLARYKQYLEESFVMRDFKAFQAAPQVLSNPRLFSHYPELIGRIFQGIYEVPAGPKERIYPSVRKHLSLGELWSIFKDARELRKL